MPHDRTRELTVVAQDPSFKYPPGHPKAGRIATALIRVPAEALADGPRGYRVHCIDYDASSDTYYNTRLAADDRYVDPADAVILGDPSFHCQNAYALVMHTLARFEFALGRRVSWGFYGHQIKVAPHAFAEANAFYSEEDHALLFGYFYPETDDPKAVFTCLSHDVIVHETTHALVDGLRTRYTDPSSADQAAFHEGFADVVALLSVFSLREVPELIIQQPGLEIADQELISVDLLTPEKLRETIGGLAEQVGRSLDPVRGQPLRQSMNLKPDETNLNDPEFEEPHRRGEVFVAAMMNAFLELWGTEIARLGEKRNGMVDRLKVIEEGARLADILLTSAIRALDYTPPVDLTFDDYVSAFLTADEEIRLDDNLQLRDTVRKSFASYGIPTAPSATESGTWQRAPEGMRYDMTHFEPMQRDPDEVFHFVWENRGKDLLRLVEDGYSRILSVRPCVRLGPDGFTLRETVCEYLQVLKVRAADLAGLELKKPDSMPDDQEIYLHGGGSLIFDEYGRLKYHIYNPLLGSKQNARMEYLWNQGAYSSVPSQLHFAGLHRMRGLGGFAFGQRADAKEVW
jgi:hypothetical protein